MFRAYGPHPAEAGAVRESPFYVSDEIPVTQAGIYPSGTTTITEPGTCSGSRRSTAPTAM